MVQSELTSASNQQAHFLISAQWPFILLTHSLMVYISRPGELNKKHELKCAVRMRSLSPGLQIPDRSSPPAVGEAKQTPSTARCQRGQGPPFSL